jgi:hypothetical protein
MLKTDGTDYHFNPTPMLSALFAGCRVACLFRTRDTRVMAGLPWSGAQNGG